MPLTDEERAIYEWQLSIPDLAEAGQEKLKDATVLISRLGGLGGTVAYQLAAAGVGRLILAHAGNLKPSDLNRQLLMTHPGMQARNPETDRVVVRICRGEELKHRQSLIIAPFIRGLDRLWELGTRRGRGLLR